MRVRDEWAAYQLDLAVLVLARFVERELAKRKSLDEILDGVKAEERLANPVAMGLATKMKVPEDGIW